MTDATTPEPRIDHSTHEHTRRGTCTLRAATPAQPRRYYSTRELIWHMAECISPDRAQAIADAIETQARPAVASEGLRDDVRFALVEIIKWDATRKWPVVPTMLSEQARAALASDAGNVGVLDVERLARASHLASRASEGTFDGPDCECREFAIDVAAAYAAAGEGEQ